MRQTQHASLKNHRAAVSAGARRTLNGREYLVAPMTLIVADSVLSGSKGPLYYPSAEVGRNVSAWNGRPLTIGHPTNPKTGERMSAGGNSVAAIGHVRNASFHNGRLTAEGWFDLGATKAADADVYKRLLQGERLEVSTGLFTDNEDRPVKTADGWEFRAIARNYRPDHVAILPDQRGACSNDDGCGVFAGNCECGGDGSRCGSLATLAADLRTLAGADDDADLLPLPPAVVNCRKPAARDDDDDEESDLIRENMRRLWGSDSDCEEGDDEECEEDLEF